MKIFLISIYITLSSLNSFASDTISNRNLTQVKALLDSQYRISQVIAQSTLLNELTSSNTTEKKSINELSRAFNNNLRTALWAAEKNQECYVEFLSDIHKSWQEFIMLIQDFEPSKISDILEKLSQFKNFQERLNYELDLPVMNKDLIVLSSVQEMFSKQGDHMQSYLIHYLASKIANNTNDLLLTGQLNQYRKKLKNDLSLLVFNDARDEGLDKGLMKIACSLELLDQYSNEGSDAVSIYKVVGICNQITDNFKSIYQLYMDSIDSLNSKGKQPTLMAYQKVNKQTL